MLLLSYMNNTTNWYAGLVKPTWAPPSWLFGPVWSILYLLIAISGWILWSTSRQAIDLQEW